jgi:ADP-ribosyl-[dinitrogen reductase] hydrolase
MLLELAIGDAYGVAFEYADENLKFNDLSRYLPRPGLTSAPGRYTDDTQMSIAVAELIISERDWSLDTICQKFIDNYKRDPRKGYSRKFQDLLDKMNTWEDWRAMVNNNSDRSGGAMRSSPCGVFENIERVKWCAYWQAAVTHYTVDGLNAAMAAALMSHYFLYDRGEKKHLGEFVDDNIALDKGTWGTPWKGSVGQKGWMDVKAAITAIMTTDTLADCLQKVVAFGGDTDTSAAITMAAASCSKEMEKNLPQVLVDGLEEGPYGKTFIQALDAQLLSIVGSQWSKEPVGNWPKEG